MKDEPSGISAILNTPLKVALVSFVLSEIITEGIIWATGLDLFLQGFVIAGVCSFPIAYATSSVAFRYRKTVEGKNRQLQALAQELRTANDLLAARNAELDTFAHTVVHDLKTPLNAIVGYAECVEEVLENAPIEVREDLRSIVQSGRKMADIIDALLLLTNVRQLEDLSITPLDMAVLVTEALNRLNNMIVERQAEIVLPGEWPRVWGYGPWVEEVWFNYISNALKYGGRPPYVELGATTTGETARFWVSDNGPGLTAAEQAKLFTPFTRLTDARAEGTGLGLSIVKRIVEKLGGEIGVESGGVPGQGSTFFFTLPCNESN
jgi:two-component system sensor histidine kinase/response regulator